MLISHAPATLQSGGSVTPVGFLPKMDNFNLNINKPKVRDTVNKPKIRDKLTKKLPTSLQKHQGQERPGKTETVPGMILGGTSNSK